MTLFRWSLCLGYAGCCSLLFYYAYFLSSPGSIELSVSSEDCSADVRYMLHQSLTDSASTSAKTLYDVLGRTFPAVSSVLINRFSDCTTRIDVALEPPIARINDSKVLWADAVIDDRFLYSFRVGQLPHLCVAPGFLSKDNATSLLRALVQTSDPGVCFRNTVLVEHELSVYWISSMHPGLIIHSTLEASLTAPLCLLCEHIFGELSLNGSFARSRINLLFDTRFSRGLVVSRAEGKQWQALSLDSKSM